MIYTGTKKQLIDYGFRLFGEYTEYIDVPFELEGFDQNAFIYELGHSRRGQLYYIMIEDGKVYVAASQADGSGGPVLLSDVLVRMFLDGVLK